MTHQPCATCDDRGLTPKGEPCLECENQEWEEQGGDD